MKAWIVYCLDGWVSLVHADTRGKAIVQVRRWVDDFSDFTGFRAKRFPKMDGKPFTYSACKEAGFEYIEDEYAGDKMFVNDCHCKVCKPKPNTVL